MKIESCRDQVAALYAVFDDVNNSDEIADEFDIQPGDIEYHPRFASSGPIYFDGLPHSIWGKILRNDEPNAPYRIRYSWMLMEDTSYGTSENRDSGTTYTNQEAYVQLQNAAYALPQDTLF